MSRCSPNALLPARFFTFGSSGLILACVVASAILAGPAAARGQDPAENQPAVENSKFHFQGVVNAASVYIRSGPGENYYPTTKLEKGASVTVVGIKFEWL